MSYKFNRSQDNFKIYFSPAKKHPVDKIDS